MDGATDAGRPPASAVLLVGGSRATRSRLANGLLVAGVPLVARIAGDRWPVTVNRLVEGSTVLYVVGEPEDDQQARVTWSAKMATDPGDGRLIPVVVGDGDQPGFAALRVAIDLRDVREDAQPPYLAEELRAAVAGLRPARASAEPVFEQGATTGRLRGLSETARLDLGRVPTRTREARQWATLSDGLYVRRDIEDELIDRLTTGARTAYVVVGAPGVGKSCILWNLARSSVAVPSRETFLLKAGWLRGDEDRAPLVEPDALTAAVGSAVRAGSTAAVLIDTADLLTGHENTRSALTGCVDAALTAGAAVVVTCRPREAELLPPHWVRTTLSEYRTDVGDHGTSEVERAVVAHATAYVDEPASADRMTEQLLQAVARRRPLGVLARGPLTLRMLFELYQPGTVPAEIDPTDLHTLFWNHRVESDRGNWGHDDERGAPSTDLTATVTRLAREMLRSGNPEVRPEYVAPEGPAAREPFLQDVRSLQDRGVGTVTRTGAFVFFHQTFFEYAAGRALFDGVEDSAVPLRALCRRAIERPDDYLLATVLEQTWLWMWRHPRHRAAAVQQALTVLVGDPGAATGDPNLPTVPALRVVAQSPDLPEPLLTALLGRVRSMPLRRLKDLLELLPAPARRPGELDREVARVCLERDDAAWASTVPMLIRLGERDDGVVAQLLWEIDIVGRVGELVRGDGGGTDMRGLVDLLARYLESGHRVAWDGLRRLGEKAVRAGQAESVASLLDRLDVRAAARDVAVLADELLAVPGRKRTTDRQIVIVAHARAHMRAVCAELDRGADPATLLHELGGLIARFGPSSSTGSADRRPIVPAERARLGGLLLAFAHHADGPTADALAAILRACEIPALHAQLHKGWLAALIAVGNGVLFRHAVRWLADGLPAPHSTTGTGPQLWADTVRRALERPDMPALRATEVARAAAGVPPDPAPWLAPDRLLRLLVKGAAVGEPGALLAIKRLADRTDRLDAEGRRVLTQQVDDYAELAADEQAMLVAVLTATDQAGALAGMAESMVDARLGSVPPALVGNAAGLMTVFENGRRSSSEQRRDESARLLSALVRLGVAPPPAWNDLTLWWGRALSPKAREAQVRIAAEGVDRGAYDRAEVIGHLDAVRALDAAPTRIDVLAARTLLVRLLAGHGTAADLARAVELSFRPPVEPTIVSQLCAAVLPDHRRGPPLDGATCRWLVEEVGRLLAGEGVGRTLSRNIGSAWQATLMVVVDRASPSDEIRLVDALPGMQAGFAEKLVSALQPVRNVRVRERMVALRSRTDLGDDLRRRLEAKLRAAFADEDGEPWPTLDADLAQSGQRPGGASR